MANFATVSDIELVLQQQILGADKVASAEFALMTVSAAIRGYCRQQIDYVVDDEVTLDSLGGKFIFLPELPVVSVTTIHENEILLVTADDYELTGFGVLVRTRGRRWFNGWHSIDVKYTHGYLVIPDVITAVCARAASRLHQAGLRASDTAGIPGVVSKSLGDFSVAYGGDSVTEGTMGASAARALLLSEKDLLDPYRI